MRIVHYLQPEFFTATFWSQRTHIQCDSVDGCWDDRPTYWPRRMCDTHDVLEYRNNRLLSPFMSKRRGVLRYLSGL